MRSLLLSLYFVWDNHDEYGNVHNCYYLGINDAFLRSDLIGQFCLCAKFCVVFFNFVEYNKAVRRKAKSKFVSQLFLQVHLASLDTKYGRISSLCMKVTNWKCVYRTLIPPPHLPVTVTYLNIFHKGHVVVRKNCVLWSHCWIYHNTTINMLLANKYFDFNNI